jgi:acyl-CoA thioester hydrolase
VRGFRFSHDAEAVFGDLDAMGHVNNTVYLKWIETARIAYWIHVTGQKARAGGPAQGAPSREPGPGVMSGVLIDMILARTEIDYKSPVSYGEKLDVFVRTSLIKRSSIVFEYVVSAKSDGRLVAQAKTVVVCYEYSLMRSKPVSQEMKAAILALDPDARVQI